MTESITVSDNTEQALRAVRRELHTEPDHLDEAIEALAHEFARRNDHLRVELSGRIKHLEQQETEEGE